MTGSLDREKGLLYDASIHLRFGEGDMNQTGQNIILLPRGRMGDRVYYLQKI